MLSPRELDEVEMLMNLRHDNIVRIVDVFDEPQAVRIVLELAQAGDLFDRVAGGPSAMGVPRGAMDDGTARFFFGQICLAVQHLHSLKPPLAHRDLKPENVLIITSGPEPIVKVTDFGLARFTGDSGFMQTQLGTPAYQAPEILRNEEYTVAVDMWALGVLLYVCLAGQMPFRVDDKAGEARLMKGEFNLTAAPWPQRSEDAKDLVRKLLVVDPTRRIDIDEALKHPFFTAHDPNYLSALRTRVAELTALHEPDPPVPGAVHSQQHAANPSETPLPPTERKRRRLEEE